MPKRQYPAGIQIKKILLLPLHYDTMVIIMDKKQLSQLSHQQQLLVEKLNHAKEEIDQLLPQDTLGRHFQRPVYSQLVEAVNNFLTPQRRAQWVIMVGLRGVGKTTLLAQLYLHPRLKEAIKFYLSLDHAQLIGAEMSDVVAAIEFKLGHPLAKAKEPVFVFLDEVHSLNKWSLAAKILYDRCPNMFLICTSSSALALWTTPDIARRARFIRVGPLSLPEVVFLNAKHEADRLSYGDFNNEKTIDPHKFLPNIDLGNKIQTALFHSENALSAFKQLQFIEPEINLYWRGRNINADIESYITQYETLPYALFIKQNQTDNEFNNIRVQIRQTLDKIYSHDLAIIGRFDQSTRQYFPALLLWLANSQQQSLNKMSKRLGINVRTLQNMFEVLVNSEVLLSLPPFGSSTGKIAKPYKYLFASPALRQALNNLATDQVDKDKTLFDNLRGCLLEDAVGSYLKQSFTSQPFGGLVEYDSSSSGADFIVLPNHIKTESIPIEIGWRKKTHQQVQATLERTKSKRYGLVITNCNLKINESKTIIFVPLKIFFLMQPPGLKQFESINLNPIGDTGELDISDAPF